MATKKSAPTTAVRTYYGCSGARGPLETYGKRHELLELDVLDEREGKKKPKSGGTVHAATLRKWRKEAGPRLVFSLVAPAAVSAVRPTKELDAALERLLEAQRLLQARFIVLATPVEVTPAALPRERLAKVVARIREGLGEASAMVHVVWQPRGVWEMDSAAEFAHELGVDLCADPLADPREPFWDESLRYLRLSAIGGRGVFPATRLRGIAELLAASQRDADRAGESFERAVVFTTPQAPKEAKRLRLLVAQLTSRSVKGGEGRVITPKNRLAREEEE